MPCPNCGSLLTAARKESKCLQCGQTLSAIPTPALRTQTESISKVQPAGEKPVQTLEKAPPEPLQAIHPQSETNHSADRPARSTLMQFIKAKSAILLTVLAILQWTLFGLLAWWVHGHLLWSVDIQLTRALQSHQEFWIRQPLIFASEPGNIGHLFTILTGASALFFCLLRRPLEGVLIVLVSESSDYLNHFIKNLIARPRPTMANVMIIEKANGLSFPSGHVTSYVATLGLIMLFSLFVLKGRTWWRYLLIIIPAFFILFIGPSRVYLGDHWTTDVVGGYLLEGGFICLWLLVYLKLKVLLLQLWQLRIQPLLSRFSRSKDTHSLSHTK
ncbi:phosphatase PAP2 family protein [Ktedonosporobacter rubrisoli]|uniref:Phosphatase PAP2 family protein n=1 Tax=Ktedonosporobacter rubrisoli TaxID=2509675 RepID=A0A4P6JTU6_KTERU|nr:phosphatase PAP2 family protein [Ktedonosporobacter rubrisoli]QBD78730.1 phosphatase PAP2 family protein [Ktedonosporobacter rubrisoli]